MASSCKPSSLLLDKVRKHPVYGEKSAEEQEKFAQELSDLDQIYCRFSHLLEPVDEEIESVIGDDSTRYMHDVEFDMAHERAKHGMARISHLPVRLFLSRLRRGVRLPRFSATGKLTEFFFVFGALHAGLIVDDIRIEWGTESLVDPQWEGDWIEEDFVAHCHQQGDNALSVAKTAKDFSIADREQKVEEKFKLMWKSAQEKHQLIINLANVIVMYNQSKSYHLFNCNCQSFVLDALQALGIKEVPTFTGQLNKYLQQLKNFTVHVPKELGDHASLDAYVKHHLRAGTLSQHDMEYLLLHYHRLHVNSAPQESDEDWKCKIRSCQYEFLADKVNCQAMLCHQFLRQRTSNFGCDSAVQPNTLPPISEVGVSGATLSGDRMTAGRSDVTVNDNGASFVKNQSTTLEEDEKVAQSMVKDDQHVAYQRHVQKGYYSQVSAKVRSMCTEKGDQEIHDLVETFTSVESYRAKYECFRGVVEEPSERLIRRASLDKEMIDQQQLHLSQTKDNVTGRYNEISQFPVKLVLCIKPNQHDRARDRVLESSLHVALFVNGYLFEWDETSLVIPKKIDLAKQPSLTTRVLHGSEWFTYVAEKRSKLESAISSPPDHIHNHEINLMFELTGKKDYLLMSLIHVIVDYNRHKTYHHTTCNNQHFIRDLSKALGVKSVPSFEASLKKQLEKSKSQCSRKLSRANLTSHADLDAYISDLHVETLRDLPPHDLEYLAAKYFYFHVESWGRSACTNQWACPEENCRLGTIEEQLERMAHTRQSGCAIL